MAMATVPYATYLTAIRQSGLLTEAQLAAVLQELKGSLAAEDAEQLAQQLVARDLITTWQNQKLLEGKARGFFLGKYKLLGHIGTGGMSTVYLGEHTLLKRRAAIKILPAQRVDDSSYLDRFLLEARAIASLDHPNIVRAYNVDNDNRTHYIAMEFIEGQDLEARVTKKGPLAPDEAADYIRQAAEGLAHAHQRQMIHRDIKPSNLLLDREGVVKISDMGLARLTGQNERSLTIEHNERVLGTTDYLAPEQAIDSHNVDHRADLYSLGCTLYFLLVGHPPFPTGSLAQRLMKHQIEEPVRLEVKRPEIPERLAEICRKMMGKKREERYQTAEEISQDLTLFLQSTGGKMATKPTAPRTRIPSDATLELRRDDTTVSRTQTGGSGNLTPGNSTSGSDSSAKAPALTGSGTLANGPGGSGAHGSSMAMSRPPRSSSLQAAGSTIRNAAAAPPRTGAGSTVRPSSGVTAAQATVAAEDDVEAGKKSGFGKKIAIIGACATLAAVIGFAAVWMSVSGGNAGIPGMVSGGGSEGFIPFSGFPFGDSHLLAFRAAAPGSNQLKLRVVQASTVFTAQIKLDGQVLAEQLHIDPVTKGSPRDYDLGKHVLTGAQQQLELILFRIPRAGSWVKYDPWYVLGPFPSPNVAEGIRQKYEPESGVDLRKEYVGKDDKKIKWQKKDFTDGQVHNIQNIYSQRNDLVAFLYRKVKADRDGEVTLHLGRDDGMVVWVNKKEVYRNESNGSVQPEEIKVKVNYKKGDNEILMKISQGGGEWGFYFADAPLSSAQGSFDFGLVIKPLD